MADLEASKPQQKEKHSGVPSDGAPRWTPPLLGWVKINADAALSKNTCMATGAAVFCNDQGDFLGASVVVSEGVTAPEVMEALACREALSLAADLRAGRVMKVATDCAGLVTSIHGDGM